MFSPPTPRPILRFHGPPQFYVFTAHPYVTFTFAAMIGLESLMGLFFLRRSVPWLDLVRVGVVALLTYAHWFWWHFRIGIKAGACVRTCCVR